jgi:hypothetical protein
MKSPILERLDEIDKLNPDPLTGMDMGALDLMEAFAHETKELKILIERYGGSSSPVIVRTLSFLLARKADKPTLEKSLLIFSLLEKLRCKNDPETLGNCLTTIHLQLIFDCVWDTLSQPPTILYPFLMHCLSYSHRQSILVQYGVLQVLSLLYEKGILEKVFKPGQLTALREKLVQLSAIKNDLLESELPRLSKFLKGTL